MTFLANFCSTPDAVKLSLATVADRDGLFAFRPRSGDTKLRAKNWNPMSYVLIRHKVANYAQWKRAVRAAAAWRRASGEVSMQVYRNSADPNDLTVVCAWANAGKMRKFMDSPELRERMHQAGVVNQPEVQFFSKAEDLTAR